MSQPALAAAEPALDRGARFTETLSSLATRLWFLALAWVLLAQQASWPRFALVLSVSVAGYLVAVPFAAGELRRRDAGQLGLAANLASALGLALLTFFTTNLVAAAVGAALVGAFRAASDISMNVRSGAAAGPAPVEASPPADEPSGVPRHRLLAAAAVGGGIGVGAVTAWLGPVGPLWLVAMMCVVVATRLSLASPGEAAAEVELGGPEEPPPAYRPLPYRLGVVLGASGALSFAGAVVLLGAWANEVFSDLDMIGVAGGALLLGAVSGGLVLTAYTGEPSRHLMFTAGYLVGGGAVAVGAGMIPAQLLVLAIGWIAGVALASVTPVVGLKLAAAAPAAVRARVAGWAGGAGVLGLPLASVLAGWVVSQAPLVVAVIVAAGCYLAAMLIPAIWNRTWRELVPQPDVPVSLLRRTPRLSARLSVMLAYTDGRWLVEVRRGRALLGPRYLVRSAEALHMLAALNLPALTYRVEQALVSDKTEASRQVERMRTELAELEAKLTGLTEMVDLSDGGTGSSTGTNSSTGTKAP